MKRRPITRLHMVWDGLYQQYCSSLNATLGVNQLVYFWNFQSKFPWNIWQKVMMRDVTSNYMDVVETSYGTNSFCTSTPKEAFPSKFISNYIFDLTWNPNIFFKCRFTPIVFWLASYRVASWNMIIYCYYFKSDYPKWASMGYFSLTPLPAWYMSIFK